MTWDIMSIGPTVATGTNRSAIGISECNICETNIPGNADG